MRSGFFLALILLLIAGCGEQSTTLSQFNPNDTQCSASVAQIAIYDGFMIRLCGCTEPSQTTIVPPATLTCTVAAGKTVYFHFIAGKTFHQLRSVGSPSFPSSIVYDPDDTDPLISINTHAVNFSASGTYSFSDTFDSSLSGQIVVP